MNQDYLRIIRAMSHPQTPRSTGEESKLQPLREIEAVLFDIYGTLFISCSGDVGVRLPGLTHADGSQESRDRPEDLLAGVLGKRFFELFSPELTAGCSPREAQSEKLQVNTEEACHEFGQRLIICFRNEVQKIHRAKRQQGLLWPEVDVRDIWRSVIAELNVAMAGDNSQVDRWAIEYEVRTNPVWPMPNASDCIDRLGSANLKLGIISNAQFYTPLLFPALLNKRLEDLAIDSEMQYYSYLCGRAKPDPWMFQQASKTLAEGGIVAERTLYVGNDLRNDVLPASQIGFRTALVATDRRSLRWREGDPSVEHVVPDLVVTNLSDVVDCVLS